MNVLLIFLFFAFISPAFGESMVIGITPTAVQIPGGEKGIGFDDLVYSSELHKVLVPAGHTGKLYLIDPVTYAMTTIDGFSSSAQFQKGHHVGISSSDEGDGYIFVADHGTHQLDAVDVKTSKIVAQASMTASADILRYVPVNHEVWVTEPDEKDTKQIEVFSFVPGVNPSLTHTMFITVPDGPESLTIDYTHQRAYTNLGDKVGVLDLKSHSILSQWPNTCDESRGTAVDEARGILFVACKEGKAVSFDLQSGKMLSSIKVGEGPDLVYYNPGLAHFYISGAKSATISVIGVSAQGRLSLLGTGIAAERSHCVVGDDQNNIWVCAPHVGQLLRYKDIYPLIK